LRQRLQQIQAHRSKLGAVEKVNDSIRRSPLHPTHRPAAIARIRAARRHHYKVALEPLDFNLHITRSGVGGRRSHYASTQASRRNSNSARGHSALSSQHSGSTNTCTCRRTANTRGAAGKICTYQTSTCTAAIRACVSFGCITREQCARRCARLPNRVSTVPHDHCPSKCWKGQNAIQVGAFPNDAVRECRAWAAG